MRTRILAGLLLAVSYPVGARADEPAAIELISLAPKDAVALRTAISRKLEESGVALLDEAATKASIQAFLHGSLSGAADPAVHGLRRQMGASHLAVIRQLPKDKGAHLVFQVKVYGPEDSTEVRLATIEETKLAEQLADVVAELLPRQLVRPADDKDKDANPEDGTTRRRGRHPGRWRAVQIPNQVGPTPAAAPATRI
jgi:hypothetical protein